MLLVTSFTYLLAYLLIYFLAGIVHVKSAAAPPVDWAGEPN